MLETAAEQANFFFATIAMTFLVGAFVLCFGRRLGVTRVYQVSFLGVFPQFLLMVLSWAFIPLDARGELFINWVYLSPFAPQLQLGFLLDMVSRLVISFAFLLAFTGLFFRSTFQTEPRPERFPASLLIGFSGLSLSWVGGTLWMSFIGLVVTAFAGFISLSGRVDRSREDADFAYRFVRDHLWGMVLCVLGASIMVVSKADLTYRTEAWFPFGFLSLGAYFLLAGVLVQFRPFPFLGWSTMEVNLPLVHRILVPQIFLGIASTSILFRFEYQFKSLGVTHSLFWVLFLLILVSLLRVFYFDDWKKAVPVWIGSVFLSFCFLFSIVDAPSALIWMIVALSGVYSLSLCGFLFQRYSGNGDQRKLLFTKLFTIFGGLVSVSVAGTAGVGGLLRAIASASTDPVLLVALTVVLFLMMTLVLKAMFRIWVISQGVSGSWSVIGSIFLIQLATLGCIWTGTLTGGLLFNGNDQIFNSLLGYIPTVRTEYKREVFNRALTIYFLLLLFSFVFGYLLLSRKFRWPFSANVSMDYWSVKALTQLRRGVTVAEGWSRLLFWDRFITPVVGRSVQKVATYAHTGTSRVTARVDSSFQRVVTNSSRAFQLIQNGDVQWYLFFIVASAMIVIGYFLDF